MELAEFKEKATDNFGNIFFEFLTSEFLENADNSPHTASPVLGQPL